MATSIILQIKAQGTEQVIAAINQIEQKAAAISAKPITVNVNTSQLNALSRLTAAQAKLVSAQNAVALAAEKTKQAQIALNAAMEKTKQAEEATAAAAEKRAAAESKVAAATEKRIASENNAAAATERRRTAEANQVNTANQRATAEANAEAATQRRMTAEINAAAAADRRAAAEGRATNATNQRASAESTALAVTEQRILADEDAIAKAQRQEILRGMFGNVTQSVNESADAMSNFKSTMLGSLTSRLVYAALNKIKQAFSEALEEMKEVDAQLTTIKKVTDASDSYISKLSNQAYSTASKYGITASDYLESVATFSRAGYKEQSASLAEVATKTQLVGDVTSETANEFLIAMDAAYDLGGSVEALSTILDQANEIDNNYATSIEKLAEAMPIIASVASTANISERQLMAALGTITATTQESGTTAARAFRAIILNIMGDTTTEIEDGVTWTADQIESLSDVLWTYSADAMRAAEATGEIVNPMEAIAGLAEAYEEGLLTESKLMEMSSALGGKLRTNELISLVKNFDMYEEMLGDIGGAAGSADKEVSAMLDSWDSKVNILKNSWTNLVQTIIETDTIKDALSDLTTVADNLTAAFVQYDRYFHNSPEYAESQAEGIEAQLDALNDQNSELSQLESKNGNLTAWEAQRLAYLQAQKKNLEEQLALYQQESVERRLGNTRGTSTSGNQYNATSAGTFSDGLKDLKSDYADASISLEEYKSGLSSLMAEYSDYIEILQDAQDAGLWLTGQEKQALSDWELMLQIWEQLNPVVEDATDTTKDNTDAVAEQSVEYSNLADSAEEATDAIKKFQDASSDQDDTFGDFSDAYEKVISEIENGRLYSNTAKAGYELLLSDEQREALGNDVEEMAKFVQQSEALTALMSGEGEDAGANFANFLYKSADAAGELRDENGKLLASFTETDNGIEYAIDDLDALADYYGISHEAMTAWANAQSVLGAEMNNTTEEVMDLAKSMLALTTNSEGVQTLNLDTFIAGLQGMGKSDSEIGGLIEELSQVDGLDFSGTTVGLQGLINKLNAAGEDTSVLQGMLDVISTTHDVALDTEGTTDAISRLEQVQSKLEALTGRKWTITVGIGGIPFMAEGGTAKGGATLVNEEGPEIIKEGNTARIAGGGAPTITDLQPGATVYTADETKRMLSGKSFKGVIQAASTGVRGNVGSGGGSGSGSGSGGGGGSSKSSSDDTDYWEELEDAVKAKLEEAEEARDAELDDLEKQIDALKEAKETEEDRLELEEKILAVQEAQTKLANVQAERSVRMYNAATGQWEWIANQKDVQSAQESLKKAQDALDEYRADKAYDEAVAAIEAQKDLVNERYDALESEWKDILESIEEPLREIADILADVGRTGTDRQKNATSNVQTLASLIATFIAENPSGWTLPGYDSGGVLSGLGGIKATKQDEIVLGPELSAKILSPTPNAQFDAFTKALGAVYGVPNATIPSATANAYGASTDSHDTVYSFPGGIHLTEAQANSTTLGDLARQLRILNLT
jgi:TP901 family phage tail tape measure protein